jgi:hypothetical protein
MGIFAFRGILPYCSPRNPALFTTRPNRGMHHVTQIRRRLRTCLKSSNEDGNEGKRENLSRNKKFAFTIFPKSAEFVEPGEKTLYHPAAWQNDKLV